MCSCHYFWLNWVLYILGEETEANKEKTPLPKCMRLTKDPSALHSLDTCEQTIYLKEAAFYQWAL